MSLKKFRYVALDQGGEVCRGDILAASELDAGSQLAARGLSLARAEAVGRNSLAEILNTEISLSPGLKGEEQALFARGLSSLLGAGLSVGAATQSVGEMLVRPAARKIISDIATKVREGQALSRAMSAHGETFSPATLAMVRSGEESGQLSAALADLADYLERSNMLRTRVRSAMYYPAFLLSMAVAAIIIVVTIVLPEFEPMFRSAKSELPLLTRIIRAAGIAIVDYYPAIIALLLAPVAVLKIGGRTAAGRRRVGRLKLSLPLFGRLVRSGECARFARIMGAQLAAGVPVVRALNMTENALTNAVFSDAISVVRASVEGGQGLARAMAGTGVFPELLIQMVRVGEQAGQMDEMLLRAADIYDQQTTSGIDKLVALLVPAMTLAMGLVIGLIVFSVMAAILGLNALI